MQKSILVVLFILGILSFSNSALGFTYPFHIDDNESSLVIRGLIDGVDDILMQEEKMWIHHTAYAIPTTIIINGYYWHPVFPTMTDGGYNIVQDSDPLIGHCQIPQAEASYTLNIIEKREEGAVRLTQVPAKDNNYTLIITLDDSSPPADWWYEFELIIGSESSETHTTLKSDNTETFSSSEVTMLASIGWELTYIIISLFIFISSKKIRLALKEK